MEEEDPGVEACREPRIPYPYIQGGSESEGRFQSWSKFLRTIVSALRYTVVLVPIWSGFRMLSFAYWPTKVWCVPLSR